jgi:hypothetical protein
LRKFVDVGPAGERLPPGAAKHDEFHGIILAEALHAVRELTPDLRGQRIPLLRPIDDDVSDRTVAHDCQRLLADRRVGARLPQAKNVFCHCLPLSRDDE